MRVSVRLRTTLEFEDLEDINQAYEIVADEMTPSEILEQAQNQGFPINIDVDED